MNHEPRGTIIQQGNTMRIDNALIEEASCVNNSSGSILISYSVPEQNRGISIQQIRLNLNNNTRILNSAGRPVCICCLQKGMWINTIFSSRMTRSIPPQSNAFLITINRRPQNLTATTINRIAFVDAANYILYTGLPGIINSQTKFILSDSTPITNRFGRPLHISQLRPGQLVKIIHANFQTASIPPQTTAYHVQLL